MGHQYIAVGNVRTVLVVWPPFYFDPLLRRTVEVGGKQCDLALLVLFRDGLFYGTYRGVRRRHVLGEVQDHHTVFDIVLCW